MFNSILSSVTTTNTLTIKDFLLCTAVSLILGILVSIIYMYKNNYNKNFTVTLALLPTIVQVIIMLVNGNLGTGVAVMGAFSLIRFRSAAGSAKEIGSIFTAMAVGLATAMGYIGIAFLFVVIIGIMNIILSTTKFAEKDSNERTLKITIPESINYCDLFDDLFNEYTKKHELKKVKTTNMGSLFELSYQIELKDNKKEKEMIDAIRCRNGNLNIVCGKLSTSNDVL